MSSILTSVYRFLFRGSLTFWKKDERGFTLIELLVVVIVLGILAAIAIPTFLGQREQAQDASAKSTVRNAQTAIISCSVERGEFPSGDATSRLKMEEIEPTIDWRTSQNIPVSLSNGAMVGVVPFEWVDADDGSEVVFGTRSASGECFYVKIEAGGTFYGRDTVCDDPWETNRDGRISATGW